MEITTLQSLRYEAMSYYLNHSQNNFNASYIMAEYFTNKQGLNRVVIWISVIQIFVIQIFFMDFEIRSI